MKNIKPVFILGNPRSGTSLLRIILNNHPEIVAPPESGFTHWWLKKYDDWTIKSTNSSRLDEYLVDLFHSKKFETWNLEKNEVQKLIIENQPTSYAELTYCIYLAYAKGKDVDVICDKNNYYVKHVNELSNIWPSAKYIHLVRDGRDVACSYLDLKNLKTNSSYRPDLTDSIPQIALEWKTNNEAIETIDSSKDDYIKIRYEDLILGLPDVLGKTCDFLNIAYSDKMLDYYKNSNTHKIEPSETLDWKKRTTEKPDQQRIGRYKNILSKSEVDKFNSIAGEKLEEYGYL